LTVKNHFIKSILLLFLITVALLHGNDYDYAIKEARSGHYTKAIQILDNLYKKEPYNQKIIYDYITVLGWAKRDREALELAQNINFNKAPDYLLQNVAKSARNAKDYKLAVRLYILGAKRFPENLNYYIGLSKTLEDINKNRLAALVLKKASKRFPQNDDLKLKTAALYEKDKNYFDAMSIYQKLLNKPKLHDKVVVKLVGTLRRLGMVFKAQEYVKKNPHLFDRQLDTSLSSDQAAYKLRWFANGYHEDKDINSGIKTLTQIDKVINSLLQQNHNLKTSKRLQNALFDKIVALHALQNYKKACKLYNLLKNNNIKLPPYVLKAAGESFLAIKKPYKAQKIFRQALQKDPKNFKLKTDLFYAYCDAYQMYKAKRYIENLDKHELPKIWDKNHLRKIPNPRKDITIMLKALQKAYSGYTPDAQEEIEKLSAKAPMNLWYKEELAKIYFYQGNYNKANKIYDFILTNNPKHFGARLGKINIFIAQNEYGKAYKTMQKLSCDFPRQHELTKLHKHYKNRTSGYFTIQSTLDDVTQNSSKQNTDGYRVKTTIYSPLLGEYWRLFVFSNNLYSKFNKKELYDNRYGIGTAFANANLEGSLNLSYNDTVIKSISPSVELSWHINDALTISGKYAKYWEGIPSRAIVNGIRADLFQTSLTYHKNEFTKAALLYSVTDFSDENSAKSIDLNLQTRLIYGPYYTLDGIVFTGKRDNSKSNRVYYAPLEDAYVTLSLVNSWNLYTFYEKRIIQKVTVEAGSHWEKNHGSKTTAAVDISQEWRWSERFGFDFGYKRNRASYDGELEYATQIYLNINGSF
jgi:biofilm PGA synthesis protein PgaA